MTRALKRAVYWVMFVTAVVLGTILVLGIANEAIGKGREPVKLGDGSLIRAIQFERRAANSCRSRSGQSTFPISYQAERSRSIAFREWVHERWAGRHAACVRYVRAQADRLANVVARMIAAAEQVKRESGRGSDPWPNCPDPYDGRGHSWQDTKDCESPGHPWHVDPPGYYCGPLQLDPKIWAHVIRRWGVPC